MKKNTATDNDTAATEDKPKKPPKPKIDHAQMAVKLDNIDELAGHLLTVLLATMGHSSRATNFCRGLIQKAAVVREELDIKRRRDTGVWENSPYRADEKTT